MVSSYETALDWLLQFSDWERGVGWNLAAAPDEQWKLGRTRALLDLAGAPDRRLRCVLVAGTKGKGSTATMLEGLARAGRWRTGLYTQPHLHSYRERVRVDGEPIDGISFAALVDRLRLLVDEFRAARPEAGEPTTFELTTALAILAFAVAEVDLAVLEVGLGGRLDATNAVDPILSVITRIGLDHTQILGSSVGQIAREKAAIMRPERPAILADQRPAARDVLVARCREIGAHCRFVRPLRAVGTTTGPAQIVRARLGRARPFTTPLGILGAHQRQNAAVALAAASDLTARGLVLTPETVSRALGSVRLMGRFDVIVGRPSVVVDAAHNADSAAALARTLAEAELPRPRWLVLGILRDKDALRVVRPLLPLVDGVVVTAPAVARALAPEALADACRRAGARAVDVAPTVADALARARVAAGPSGTVVATGSFAVVSEARVALGLAARER